MRSFKRMLRQPLSRRGSFLWSDQSALAGEASREEPADQARPSRTQRLNDLVIRLLPGQSALKKRRSDRPQVVCLSRVEAFQTHVSEFRGCVQLAWWGGNQMQVETIWPGLSLPASQVRVCLPTTELAQKAACGGRWCPRAFMHIHTHVCVCMSVCACACPSVERRYCLVGCGSSLCIGGFSLCTV